MSADDTLRSRLVALRDSLLSSAEELTSTIQFFERSTAAVSNRAIAGAHERTAAKIQNILDGRDP